MKGIDQLCLRNKNMLWGGVIAGVLEKLGVTVAVICPGSRSAPLTIALSTLKTLETIPVLDERSAAFFALGIAKQTHHPVALVCTSGTAAANYFPAVIEAHYSGVPLILLTADRPPHLQACSAGQTIDQLKIYGDYVRWHLNLAMPSSEVKMLEYLRQTVIQAYERSLHPEPGPVHLNVPFDDDLAPVENDAFSVSPKVVNKLIADTLKPEHGRFTPMELPYKEKILSAQKGIVIAGTHNPKVAREYALMIKQIADHLGWPVLCDVLSPLRNMIQDEVNFVINYDFILRNKRLRKKLKPDLVLNIGALPTSKVLRGWLEESEAETYILDSGWSNLDPLHRKCARLAMTPTDFVELLQASFRPFSSYGKEWIKYEGKGDQVVYQTFHSCDYLFEGKVPYILSKKLPEGTPIFIANSMPIRDAEYFWQKNSQGYQPFFNRGANGIDGTLSTAMGVAFKNQPAVLLAGDLSFLHDVNGLLNRQHFQGSLTIVLINNEGGGIFENLPIANYDPPFEEYFATPQYIEFERIANTYNLQYHNPKTWDRFIELIRKLPPSGIRLIEMRTDRKEDVAFRRSIFAKSEKLV